MQARFFRNEPKQNINNVESIRIMLASAEDIKSWSSGEVSKPETINYRTFKPERDGLFCAKIFGPVTDWECLCGRYKRMKYKGIVCEKCGVEVTQSKVRRERMGHITLAAPVSHIWFFKGLPSRIGAVLNLTIRELERVLYFESYIVTDPGGTELVEGQVLSEDEWAQAIEEFGTNFEAGMGAESVQTLLAKVDPELLAEELRCNLKDETSKQKKQKLSKRLKIVESFVKSGGRPDWMVLTVLPVIPPELRPLVPLDGGRFATSDLNDLYRRVINRNNRLKKLLDLRAPEVIIRNEKRMLQESVDALFDNGRRGRVLKGTNNRPLKSLSDTLKGKQGRFRQNLLGKRVDYSGRSVIVVGPELKLHQCGLPKKMALELFKPFIYNKLEERGLATTIKQAREMVERGQPEVYDILEEVIQNYPVLLNRAPTLHRLGIQAFEPVLVEGKAIRLHPLVCTAFNADFDGDQMAVHVPLSPTAQLEAHVLMKSSMNVLLPASGKPIIVPTQDVVLGMYYLTRSQMGVLGEGKVFGNVDEVVLAYETGRVDLHAKIKLRYTGALIDLDVVEDNQAVVDTEPSHQECTIIDTTVGRAIFNEALLPEMPFINGLIKKRGLADIVNLCYLRYGRAATVKLADQLKDMGFFYSTKGGISIGIQDMLIPDQKASLTEKARQEVFQVEKQYMDGAITNRERYNKVIDIWHHCTDSVADAMFNQMKGLEEDGSVFNPIFIMADSGARGSKQQMRQLAGMRGLMAKPSGEIIEQPITNNFREGLNVLQYFISTHGARKGLADTALKTADSGYLTRRLVDVSQDIIISLDDCGTIDGIGMVPLVEAGKEIESLRDRILGRVTLESVRDPYSRKVVVKAGEIIDEALAQKIQDAGVDKVKVRSVLTCETRRGACAKCYGRHLATGKLVELGEAVGIIAAQSIGEPGTQLTMRTFHIGGTASKGSDQFTHSATHDGTLRFHNVRSVTDQAGDLVALNRTGYLAVEDEKGLEKERHSVVYGAHLKMKDGIKVKKGTLLAEWDPYTSPILSDIEGAVHYKDCIEGTTMSEELDAQTGLAQRVIIEFKDPKIEPRLVIRAKDKKSGGKSFTLPAGAHIMVEEGEMVYPGGILAKIPRESAKTKDITGGLPRVVELFEARRPKAPAIISEIDGEVKIGEVVRGKRQILITSSTGNEHTYEVPKGVHLNVHDGETLRAGDPLIDGPEDPHDILKVLGPDELQKYMVNEIQEVYRLQGVNINDKHIEVIVSQMMRWVRIKDPGDTRFLEDQQVDKWRFTDENEKAMADGGKPSLGEPLLLGITKAALSTDSWVSAASFQETTRVLTEAAVSGAEDFLVGLKENVIMGRLIPAGTGFQKYLQTAIPFDPTIKPKKKEEITLAQLTSDLLVGRDFNLEELKPQVVKPKE